MKLSELLGSLSRGARDLEVSVAKWEAELDARGDQLQEQAKTWLDSAQKRDEEVRAEIGKQISDASDKVKAQWAKTQADWDAEFERVKAKAAEARKKAEALHAEDTADWYEAYAAHAVSFAQRMQAEASNAVAAAAKARADLSKKG